MVGTLWKCKSGILVCIKFEDGFLDMMYMDGTGYRARNHISNMHMYYTQLTQPTEET